MPHPYDNHCPIHPLVSENLWSFLLLHKNKCRPTTSKLYATRVSALEPPLNCGAPAMFSTLVRELRRQTVSPWLPEGVVSMFRPDTNIGSYVSQCPLRIAQELTMVSE